MRKLTLLLMVATMFVYSQAFGMGLDFGSPTVSVVEPTIEEPEFGNFTNPKTISNVNKDWLITVDRRTGDVFVVNKQNTLYDKFLFHIEGRITSVLWAYGHVWVGNLDGANAPGGAVEVYDRQGKLIKKMHKVVWYASDMAKQGNRLFVVDSGDHTLKIFDTFGWLLETIQMTRPCNVYVHGNSWKSSVYVSDNGGTIDTKYGKKTIDASVTQFRQTAKGKWKKVNVWKGSDYGFSRPRGLTVKNGVLYVVDSLIGQIVSIELGSNLLLNPIGEFGGQRGQMISPKDMYYDEDTDTFYVVDGFKGSIEAVKEY